MMIPSRPRLAALVAGLATLALGGCQSDEPTQPLFNSSSDLVTETGEFGPRAAALSAFQGQMAPLSLVMNQYTVEGTLIPSRLDVSPGRAVLTIDERADGGGVRVQTITSLILVQLVPSVWVNNVEVKKEYFEPVPLIQRLDTHARVYYLVDAQCLMGPCTKIF